MNKNSKKVALKFATFAALFGVMSFFMDMMEENEEQITYSVTLQDLALGNGETNGENGGTVGSGGADGESDGGTTGGGGNGNSTPSGNGASTKYEHKAEKDITITRMVNGELVSFTCDSSAYTVCEGRGDVPCTPVIRVFDNCRRN